MPWEFAKRELERSEAHTHRHHFLPDSEEEGKKWADYLEKLSPEDFGKYKV